MSVDDLNVVDIVGVDKHTGNLVLTISDHLDWSNTSEHMLILQAKINKYLAFVESGEILEKFPNAGGRKVVIEVIGEYRLPLDGHKFIRRVTDELEKAGFGFRSKLFKGRQRTI